MNLSEQEKKLFSNGWKILVGIVILGILYFAVTRTIGYFENRNIAKSKVLIEKYETRIDSLNAIGKTYVLKINKLSLEIDSLHKIKYQIITNNEKKINTVYNADAVSHAKWLDSVLTEMDGIQR